MYVFSCKWHGFHCSCASVLALRILLHLNWKPFQRSLFTIWFLLQFSKYLAKCFYFFQISCNWKFKLLCFHFSHSRDKCWKLDLVLSFPIFTTALVGTTGRGQQVAIFLLLQSSNSWRGFVDKTVIWVLEHSRMFQKKCTKCTKV